MKIKMQTIKCGADWSADPGEVVDVPDAEGKALCEGGYAVPVKDQSVERATVKPPETSTAKGKAAKGKK